MTPTQFTGFTSTSQPEVRRSPEDSCNMVAGLSEAGPDVTPIVEHRGRHVLNAAKEVDLGHEACRRRQVALGAVWVWQNPLGWRHEVVVCLPTKAHWKDESRVEDIDSGLRSLRQYLDAADSELTVAVPMLGAGLGGLSVEQVSPLIRERLSNAKQDVYLYAPLDVTPPGTT